MVKTKGQYELTAFARIYSSASEQMNGMNESALRAVDCGL